MVQAGRRRRRREKVHAEILNCAQAKLQPFISIEICRFGGEKGRGRKISEATAIGNVLPENVALEKAY